MENPPRNARTAVTLVFFLNGAGFSSWIARIPEVQNGLAISEGQLGLALLGLGFGALVSLLVAGGLVVKLGSRPVTALTAVMFCILVPLPALAPSLITLALALFVLGVFGGALDVAMNAQGVLVQQRYGRPVLSSMHAAFSFGGFAGAATGGLVAGAGVSPAWHLLGVAAVLGAAAYVSTRWLLPASADASKGGPTFARPSRALAALGIVAFCGLVMEGGMADWSAVYLSNVLDTGPGLAAGGFAAFSLTMGIGRLTGDRLVYLFNSVTIVRYGSAIAAAGMALALLATHPLLVIIAFALVGAGLANIIPIIFSASANIPGTAPGPAIAAVATTSYFGFLAGPPAIGLVAELVTLRVALVILVVLAATMTLLSGTIRR
ncbi:MFS transporter [soil metagenome]